jgi:hypothetical protein
MVVTNSITPAKPVMKSPKRSFGQQPIAALGLLICCGLLMLAVPRLLASGYALYPESATEQNQDKFTTDIYERCISDLKQALLWNQSAHYWQIQAAFYQRLFNTHPFQEFQKKRTTLKNIQSSIQQGLAISPVDPFGWFHLAKVNKLLETPKPEVINALQLSFYAERVEPELVINRLAFSYEYYADFNHDLQQLWQNQLLTAWTFTPGELIKFVAQNPETKEIALQAFVNSPDDAEKFLHDLERTLKKPL